MTALVPLGRPGDHAPALPRRVLQPQPEPDAVVVLRFSALGDVILTSPAIDALRTAWPRTRIVYAVKERLRHLVAHNPQVDAVVPLRNGEGPWSFSRRLRAAADVPMLGVLDLHNKIRSKLLRALLPSGRRVVFHKRDWKDTLPVKLALRPWRAPMLFADRYHSAVEELVGRELPRGRLRTFLGPDDVALADAELRRAGLDPEAPLLGMSPGANWETKRWPAERYAELARRARARGLQVAVQGSADEAALCRDIAAAAPGTADLSGRLDLRALGGFLSRCTAFVANDSGPMHMARGLGVPTLALFGSTDPGMFEWDGHAVLFAGVECSPCSFFGRRKCPRGHFRCMRDLDADQAWDAVEQLLVGGRRAFNHA